MGSDRARVSYDANQQYRAVVAQQGRVTLEADWNEASTNEAIRTTKDVILGQIEALISQGLEIFHAHDSQGRELARTVEENASKEREIKRLRASAEQSRATISVSFMSFVHKYERRRSG